jgi:hypothetical protein
VDSLLRARIARCRDPLGRGGELALVNKVEGDQLQAKHGPKGARPKGARLRVPPGTKEVFCFWSFLLRSFREKGQLATSPWRELLIKLCTLAVCPGKSCSAHSPAAACGGWTIAEE